MEKTEHDSIVIRRAEKTDIRSLIQIRLMFLEDSFRPLTTNETREITLQLEEYYFQHLNIDLFAMLACLSDKIVSCAFIVIDDRPANLSFLTGKIGTILNVYTIPDSRGKGLATSVMTELLDIGREQGISRIDLKATELGLPLYRKFGFHEEGHEHVNMVLHLE